MILMVGFYQGEESRVFTFFTKKIKNSTRGDYDEYGTAAFVASRTFKTLLLKERGQRSS